MIFEKEKRNLEDNNQKTKQLNNSKDADAGEAENKK